MMLGIIIFRHSQMTIEFIQDTKFSFFERKKKSSSKTAGKCYTV